jgi:hypothetical protein
MSYALYDTEGYVGDFGTAQGLRDLMARKDIRALNEFIHTMEADPQLVKVILHELAFKPDLKEYRDLFEQAVPPVTLEDGITEDAS